MNIKNIIKIFALLILLVVSIGIVSAEENITEDTLNSTTNDILSSAFDSNNYTSADKEPLNTTNQYSVSNTDSEQLSSTNKEILSYDDSVADKVEQSTADDRTFKLGKYKITLSKNQYSKFAYIKNSEETFFETGDYKYYETGEKYDGYGISTTGLYYYVVKYTGKSVKQKIGIGFKGYKYKTLKVFKTKKKAKKYYKKHKLGNSLIYEYDIKKVKIKNKVRYKILKVKPIYKKIKTKKAKVYIEMWYGQGQCGYPKKYHMFLTTDYQNPGYDIFSGWISASKTSKSLYTLNSAKLKKY